MARENQVPGRRAAGPGRPQHGRLSRRRPRRRGAASGAGRPGHRRGPATLARVYSQAWSFVLIAAGDLAAAAQVSAAGLDQAREASDLWNQSALLPRIADLDLRAGRTGTAAAHPAGRTPARRADRQRGRSARRPGGLRDLVPRDRALRRSPDGRGRVRRAPAARGRHRAGLGGAALGGPEARGPAGARARPGAGGGGSRCGDELGHGRGVRSPPTSTSALARSAPIWTGSGTRPAAAAAPT
jgi:hypothetical protein